MQSRSQLRLRTYKALCTVVSAKDEQTLMLSVVQHKSFSISIALYRSIKSLYTQICLNYTVAMSTHHIAKDEQILMLYFYPFSQKSLFFYQELKKPHRWAPILLCTIFSTQCWTTSVILQSQFSAQDTCVVLE